MGKPFANELENLGSSLRWVVAQDQSALEKILASPVNDDPLVTVGSGGSQSAAIYAAMLHRCIGGVAFSMTPLELLSAVKASHLRNVLLLSASGSNKDILAAARLAVASEVRHISCLTTNPENPLSELIRQTPYGSATNMELPSGGDGFLATNSLVATMAALYRQYGFPADELSLIADALGNTDQKATDPDDEFLRRPEWIVVHAGWGAPAAFDLESKLSEAALRTVQLTDLRNFAHGRHHWLAKRAESTCIIFFTDEEHFDLSVRTAGVLPSGVPCAVLRSDFLSPAGAIELTCRAMKIVQRVGSLSGIDPGRPGVPAFGREIYHLGPRDIGAVPKIPVEVRAAARKEHCSPLRTPSDKFVAASTAFLARLKAARFSAIVFDFDGTLVDPKERFTRIREPLVQCLEALLNAGVGIGIATGRGRSVRDHLRGSVPERHWHRVLVGYYNGADTIPLSSEALPERMPASEGPIFEAASILGLSPVSGQIDLDLRPCQLTVVPKNVRLWSEIRRQIQEILMVQLPGQIKIFESSHSIDILPLDVSKLSVVARCQEVFGSETVLCIGDRGRWPGNDCELLSSPFSLSVDTVSSSLDSCWNLLPVGVAGAAGTLRYLTDGKLHGGFFRFRELK